MYFFVPKQIHQIRTTGGQIANFSLKNGEGNTSPSVRRCCRENLEKTCPLLKGEKGILLPCPGARMAWPSVADFSVPLQNPALQHRTILSVLPRAGTADRRNSCGVVGRQENRQNCSALLFLCLPLLPSLQPLHLQPDSQPPRTCRLGPFVCVVLSWEEVPSRLTLRKWFQSVLVWILAGFCNCQFPYQSVCISKGRTRATSPLFFLSSFVLREVLLPPPLLGLVGGYWRDEAVCRTWFVRDAWVPVPVWGASVSVGSRA